MAKSPSTPSPISLDVKLGPCMAALNPRQRGFVIAFCTQGGINAGKAALAAGYTGTPGYISVQGYRLAHSENIQAAIHEEVCRRQQAMAVRAQHNIEKIANSSTDKDKFAANKLLLALGGHTPTMKSETIVRHELSTNEMLDKIRTLGALLGPDVLKKLMPPVIDITPTK